MKDYKDYRRLYRCEEQHPTSRYFRVLRFRLLHFRISRFFLSHFRLTRFRVSRFRLTRFRMWKKKHPTSHGFRVLRFRLSHFRISRFRFSRFRLTRFRVSCFRLTRFRVSPWGRKTPCHFNTYTSMHVHLAFTCTVMYCTVYVGAKSYMFTDVQSQWFCIGFLKLALILVGTYLDRARNIFSKARTDDPRRPKSVTNYCLPYIYIHIFGASTSPAFATSNDTPMFIH